MRKFKYGCGVIGQNFLLNYSLFKITINPSKKVEFSSEKQKDMSDDGTRKFRRSVRDNRIKAFDRKPVVLL